MPKSDSGVDSIGDVISSVVERGRTGVDEMTTGRVVNSCEISGVVVSTNSVLFSLMSVVELKSIKVGPISKVGSGSKTLVVDAIIVVDGKTVVDTTIVVDATTAVVGGRKVVDATTVVDASIEVVESARGVDVSERILSTNEVVVLVV